MNFIFGVPEFELVYKLQRLLEPVCSSLDDEEFAFSIGKYYVCVNYCSVLVADEEYRLLDFADMSEEAEDDSMWEIISNIICPFVATRSGICRLLAEMNMPNHELGCELSVCLMDKDILLERLREYNPLWLGKPSLECECKACERRKVLFTHGMGNDRMLIITDAPKEAIEEWCRRCVAEMETGENTYFDTLKSQYYVRELLDSEEHDIEDVEIIGYDEEYELTDYYDFSDE